MQTFTGLGPAWDQAHIPHVHIRLNWHATHPVDHIVRMRRVSEGRGYELTEGNDREKRLLCPDQISLSSLIYCYSGRHWRTG